MDQGREVCPKLDEIVLQAFRLEPGETCAFHTGLQSGQLSSAVGSSTGNQALVTAYSACADDKNRYVIFQMAEAAVSRKLFAEILFRIDRLRCCSA